MHRHRFHFILFFISIIPFFKQSYLAFGIFFIAGVCMVIASTYKKLLDYDSTRKVLLLSKNYLGMTLSKKQIQLTKNSQLKLVSEKVKGTNSMGYYESSNFETLSITGLVDSANTLSEVVLCSEHMAKKRKPLLKILNPYRILLKYQ